MPKRTPALRWFIRAKYETSSGIAKSIRLKALFEKAALVDANVTAVDLGTSGTKKRQVLPFR